MALISALAAPAPPEAGRWGRAAANPVLTASATWEEAAVFEPTVIYENGIFKMWYSGAWINPATGYATSSDGITWTKYVGNPVLGQGGSGFAGIAVRNCVMKHGSTYYCYFADGNPIANIRVATSVDGLAWTVNSTPALSHAGTWAAGWANTHVWYDTTTLLWNMLVEGTDGSLWKTAYATSADGLTFTLQTGPLTSLQVGSGMYGGPWLLPQKIGGLYHLYHHASTVSGNLPTDLYRATSADLLNWTPAPGPVLTHLGTGFEFDQVADPCVLDVAGKSYLYYDGDNNVTSTASIGLATFGGSLADLLAGPALGRALWRTPTWVRLL